MRVDWLYTAQCASPVVHALDVSEYLGIIQTKSPQNYDRSARNRSAGPASLSLSIPGFLPSSVETSRLLKDHANLDS
jgi:hypothetical protein